MSSKLCCCFDHRKRVWTFSDLLVRWSRLPTAKILRPADLHIVSVLEGCYQWLYLLAWRHPLLCVCQFVPSVAVPSGMKTPTVVHVSVGATSGCTFWHEDTHCCACVSLCHQWLYLLAWRHPLLCMCQLVPPVAVPAGMKTPTVVHVSVGATSGCTFWHEDTHCCACVSWCHQWLYLLLWWHWGMQTVLQCISWCCQWLYLLPWWHWGTLFRSVSVGAVSDCTSCYGDTETRCLTVYQLVLSVTVPLAMVTLRHADCHAAYQLVLSVTLPLAVKTLRYADHHVVYLLVLSVTVPLAVKTLRYADCHAVYLLVLSVTVPLAVKTLRYADHHVVYLLVLSVTVPLAVKTLRYADCHAVYLLQLEVVYLLLWTFWAVSAAVQCVSSSTVT